MRLAAIRDYVKTHGIVSLKDVSIHFDIAPDTAQFALNYWQKQGKIRQQTVSCGQGCGSTSCANAADEIYEWVERAIPLRFIPFQRR